MKGKFYHLGVGENPWLSAYREDRYRKIDKKIWRWWTSTVGATDLNTEEEAECAREEIIKILNKSFLRSS